MAVRRQRATTSKEIMEKDINIAIQKAKTRFRYGKEFYILKYTDIYFASGYPDQDKTTGEEVYFQKWSFNEIKGRWEEELK
jgi:hypothetical protein